MFCKKNDSGYIEVIEGIERKTTAHGEKTLMTEFRLAKGHTLPLHSHPHEQTGCLVSGRMVLIIDGTEHEAGPGDSWCIRGGVEHGARVIEDAIAVEVFAPVREEYL